MNAALCVHRTGGCGSRQAGAASAGSLTTSHRSARQPSALASGKVPSKVAVCKCACVVCGVCVVCVGCLGWYFEVYV